MFWLVSTTSNKLGLDPKELFAKYKRNHKAQSIALQFAVFFHQGQETPTRVKDASDIKFLEIQELCSNLVPPETMVPMLSLYSLDRFSMIYTRARQRQRLLREATSDRPRGKFSKSALEDPEVARDVLQHIGLPRTAEEKEEKEKEEWL